MTIRNRLHTAFRQLLVLTLMAVPFLSLHAQRAGHLVGAKFDLVLADTAFTDPYIDVDEMRTTPVKHRYVHGGFRSNGTRFSFYFPDKKDYKGHFFQYVTPFPDSETTMQALTGSSNMIGFAVSSGAYFVETNGGGQTDFTNPTAADPTIGAYRSHAACAELSRLVAQRIMGGDRPYGYVFGGSGGAYRTLGCIEQTTAWEGAVPYVLGSPTAIPNVFSVRMHALRVLKDKLPQIVDAMEPGGSGDPYAGLNQEEYQTLREASAMGFPLKAWYGWKQMDVHGFLVLYKSVVAMDEQYFRHDFWNEHGYLGANPTPSLLAARVQHHAKIVEIYSQEEAEKLGLVEPMDPEDRGTADRAWEAAGLGNDGRPVAFKLDSLVPEIGMGGDLLIDNQDKRIALQIKEVKGDVVIMASTNTDEELDKATVGTAVTVDNSDFLAVQTYHRHQVPSRDYEVWDCMRNAAGDPIYPQRPMQLGPIFTQGASGVLPTGKPNGKVILCCSLYDREAFPWQGDWYRKSVAKTLGAEADNNFRLWYTDRAIHGDSDDQLDDMTEVVSYNGVVQQALLDLSKWVEEGIEPAHSTNYTITDGQVIVPATATERQGIQPVVSATVKNDNGAVGAKMAEVAPGTPVTVCVKASVPSGTGKIVSAEWSLDGENYTETTDLEKEGRFSNDGCDVEFEHTVRYDTAGDHFVAVRVTSQRNGKASTYTRIMNLDRIRVRVK